MRSGAPPVAPARTLDPSKPHLRRTHRARPGGHVTPPSISGPSRLTRMRTQVPIMIVPAGDLRPKATGRLQVPEYDGSATSPLKAQHGVSCILQRPLCAHSNGIQQPPSCRPTGGPDGFDSHGSSTPHLTYVAAWDQPSTTYVTGHARGRKFLLFYYIIFYFLFFIFIFIILYCYQKITI